jgi:LysM repeat protein
MTQPTRTLATRLVLAALAAGAVASAADAQSLRGSRSSVELMYTRAVAADLEFHQTPDDVYAAAGSGKLKLISVTEDVALDETRYPFVLPQTLDFITTLAAQYHEQCGERLIVTSAARPVGQQPRNAARESVHPTGMAVDFHRPPDPCRTWMRKALVELEDRGVIEATEERHPPHFHVAVLQRAPAKYAVNVDVKGLPAPRRVEALSAGDVVTADTAKDSMKARAASVAAGTDTTPTAAHSVKTPAAKRTVVSKAADPATSTSASPTSGGTSKTTTKNSTVASTGRAGKAVASKSARNAPEKRVGARVRASVYRVQRGDNLSTIALRYSTTVKRHQELNSLSTTKLRAGQRLRLP